MVGLFVLHALICNVYETMSYQWNYMTSCNKIHLLQYVFVNLQLYLLLWFSQSLSVFLFFILNCRPASEEVLYILYYQKILIGLHSCSRSFFNLLGPY